MRFTQVDVFSSEPLLGNPVAVVHDADGVGDEEMARFARWTNLSETAFLLPPTDGRADYRVRIFTPDDELPFAGHPTLGSAHAWLEAGGTPRGEHVVQECGAGLVTVRRVEGRLAFEAPPLTRSGEVSTEDQQRFRRALGLAEVDVVEMAWIDNGPGWVGILLHDADAVLSVHPDRRLCQGLDLGVVGPYAEDSEVAVEVRAFTREESIGEDPVTGSLNAGIAQWLAGTRLPTSYVASQGTVLGRRGRVHVEKVGEAVWVGGDTRSTITGEVRM